MSRRTILTLSVFSIACAVYAAASLAPTGASKAMASVAVAPTPLAAPGTVEPASEEIDVGSELTGKLERVLVEDGDRVRAGQILAMIANSDYQSQVASARATLDDRVAALRRMTNGARLEERQEARSVVDEADAVLAAALVARDRRRGLLEQGAISREENDRAEEAWSVAVAKRRAAGERFALVDGAAREEDRARAEAAVAMATAALEAAQAALAKTSIRSPIDGAVLRRHRHAGETVVNSATDPIVTLGDISRLRVRAELDELDVAAAHLNQRVMVRTDSYPGRTFPGVVTRIGESLGKKRIRTEQAAERIDTKVLEVLVLLDPGADLRPGLRVDVFIERGKTDAAE